MVGFGGWIFQVMNFAVVTGGVGCGKSAFADLVAKAAQGRVEHFSCDEAAHHLWERVEVRERIGDALRPFLPKSLRGEALDRRSVRELVFGDAEVKKRLEDVLHPLIFARLEDARRQAQKRPETKVFLAEVPLYYESRASLPADKVIVVAASRMVQRARLIEHRNLDASTCEAVLNSQLPLEVKTEKADVVIWNDGSLAAMEAQASILLKSIWPLFSH